jgi:uncharacterized membrane protein YgcG
LKKKQGRQHVRKLILKNKTMRILRLSLLPLITCILITIQTGYGFNYPLTARSADYLSQTEFNDAAKTIVMHMAYDKGMSASLFEKQFEQTGQALMEHAVPNILIHFRELEKNLSRERELNLGFTATRQLYYDAMKAGITEALTDDEMVKGLFVLDNSDRILHFESQVEIGRDGWLRVKEKIRVYNGDGDTRYAASANDEIKRGLLRELPTLYFTEWDFRSTTGFELLEILRDGKPELYQTESAENGKVLRIGNAEQLLPTGVFTYEITYRTNRQLIAHPDRDECYWNVNGNGWSFSIDTLTCTLVFPEGTTIKEEACYTGFAGSREQACTAEKLSNNRIRFRATRRMQAYEGMTVAAAIPAGTIKRSGALEDQIQFLADNPVLPAGFLLLALVFGLNYRKWRRVGRDPEKGIIIPQFQAPGNLSAAEAGFILLQKFDMRLFAAALVEMAVNRVIKIQVNESDSLLGSTVYTLHAEPYIIIKDRPDFEKVYGLDKSALDGLRVEKGKYNIAVASKIGMLRTTLEQRYVIDKKAKRSGGLFSLNRSQGEVTLTLLVFLGLFGIIFYLAFFPSTGGAIAGVVAVLLSIIIQAFFNQIMKAYTKTGREMADQIEGFRLYLSTTDEHRFDSMNPPEKNLALYEKYLPYAIALGCENKWSEKFEKILESAIQSGYRPSYFSGNFRNGFSSSAFSSGLSSGIRSTISSAATPPSKSSGGSSGGGSSGGGGGGGGGGGW